MIEIDTNQNMVILKTEKGTEKYSFQSREAFGLISKIWLRIGWDTKYVYGFSWMGRPVIQLPEDLVRSQEVIYIVKPDVLIETGVAHGGSLIFYASLFKAMGKGRIVGIDIEIRPHNLNAIEDHSLSEYITLIEGSSTDDRIVQKVKSMISSRDKVLIMLDSNHSKDHVLAELNAYAPIVSVGSYIVAQDGIMGDLQGAPRSQENWSWNNPKTAAEEFVKNNSDFIIEEPQFPFNEGMINQRVTYWPSAFIKRIK